MLTPPNLPTSYLIERLATEFDVQASQLEFLPIGADADTAVYRVEEGGSENRVFFFKLRRGAFNPVTVELPAYLYQQGLRALIPPLPSRTGQAWAQLDDGKAYGDGIDRRYAMILYPYIAGVTAYRQAPTPEQWRAFGAALAQLHAARLPAELAGRLPRETFPTLQRDTVRAALAAAGHTRYSDPVAVQLAADLLGWRATITAMLDRTDALAHALRAQPPEFVVCHSDIHAGNLHLAADGRLYLVDWDAPLYAPKERDLLLIGGCPTWNDPREAAWFFEGYGPQELHSKALVYYRYQRVIEDIAAYCRQLFDSEEGGEDRAQSLRYLRGNFAPGGEIAFALETDRRLAP